MPHQRSSYKLSVRGKASHTYKAVKGHVVLGGAGVFIDSKTGEVISFMRGN